MVRVGTHRHAEPVDGESTSPELAGVSRSSPANPGLTGLSATYALPVKIWRLPTAVLAASLAVDPRLGQRRPPPSRRVDHWSDGDTVVDGPRHHPADRGQRADTGRAATGRPRRSPSARPGGTTVTAHAAGRARRHRRVRPAAAVRRRRRRRHRAEADQEGSQAKYDSTDGYDKHPQQKQYRQQDIKHRDYCANHDLKSYRPVSDQRLPAQGPDQGQPQRRLDLPPPARRRELRDHQPRGVLRAARTAPRRPATGPPRLSAEGRHGRKRRLPTAGTRKCTRARPGREGGRALIVHASVGQRLDRRRPVKREGAWRPVPPGSTSPGRRVTRVEARFRGGNRPVWTTDTHHGV